ncbi:MAG: hypothetical protein ACK4K2_01550 [Dehalococcoidia bacterium]
MYRFFKPHDPKAWVGKGFALTGLGRHQEAVEWLCRAWKARERLPDKGASVEKTLRHLGVTPDRCQ